MPLILAGWWASSDIDKASRLGEHIKWAVEHDALGEISAFLSSLDESDWHHIGE